MPHDRFSHPVGDLAAAALAVNEGAGSVEKVVSQGPRGSMCSDFLVYAKVPFSPWDSATTTLCLSLAGDRAPDVFGTAFSDAKNCTTLDHRRACHPSDVLHARRCCLGFCTRNMNVQVGRLITAMQRPWQSCLHD